MKTIYILLTRTNTILSKLVGIATKEAYTHAAISFDSEFTTVYSSSRKNGRTIFPAGPCIENLDNDYYKRHTEIPCAVYELQVSDEAYEQAKKEVEQIIAKSEQYHFNIIGLLLCQLNIPYHRKHYFFCSQFVGEILNRSHALVLPKDTSLMKPCDYTRLPELLCRFRGYIGELAAQRQLSLA